ncbi:hypothetical protein [Streptomyces sp. NBC_01358]|uniref:hypothetical protein n=1 Tax=Streptomyces sp. NBC_01358 TaxID=2903837 RepID=UPI002E30D81D|nr:hypothetical protein [Streptomyces sp. NBC_01358]
MRLSLPRAATAAALAAVVATAVSPASANTSNWRDISPPGSEASILRDVETGGGATWAIGRRTDAATGSSTPVALRWTRAGWQAPPQPTDQSRLEDLTVGAPDQVWTAGTRNETVDGTEKGHERALLQHWNGSAWNEVTLPFPEGVDQSTLSAVDTDADGAVWVYGGYTNAGGEYFSVLFRGDADAGGHWTLLPAETGLTWVSQLKAVPGDGTYAIGDGISRFDGTSWTRQNMPPTLEGAMFDGIAVRTTTNEVWAAGYIRDETLWRRPVIVRYDGRSWRRVRTPAETGQLSDIAFDGSGRPVAVGESLDPAVSPDGNYVLTLGPRGSLIQGEELPGAGYLYAAASDSAGRIWAVGGAAGAENGMPPSVYAGIRR